VVEVLEKPGSWKRESGPILPYVSPFCKRGRALPVIGNKRGLTENKFFPEPYQPTIYFAAVSGGLENRGFFVVSEDFSADVHDLAEGRVCFDGFDYGVH
jgi:hypothetical protein